MEKPEPDIATLVTEFMAKQVWHGKPMGAWLSIGLPEVLQAAEKQTLTALQKPLDLLKTKTKNALIGVQRAKTRKTAKGTPTTQYPEKEVHIGDLGVKNGTLERYLPELRERYGRTFGGYSQLITDITQYNNEYRTHRELHTFIVDELMPVLQSLKDGNPPNVQDLATLREASRKNPEATSMADSLRVAQLSCEQERTTQEFKVVPGTSRDIANFLETLTQKVENALKGSHVNRLKKDDDKQRGQSV